MVWAKICDTMPDNQKLRRCSPSAAHLYTMALSRALTWRSNGIITHANLRFVWQPYGARFRCVAAAKELVKNGLWEEHAEGYLIHDFLKYQPSLEKLDAERDMAAQRKRKQRKKEKQELEVASEWISERRLAGHQERQGRDRPKEAKPVKSVTCSVGHAVTHTTPDPVPDPITSSGPSTAQYSPSDPDLGSEPHRTQQTEQELPPSSMLVLASASAHNERKPATRPCQDEGMQRMLPTHSASRWRVGKADYVPPVGEDFETILSPSDIQYVLASELNIKGTTAGVSSQAMKKFLDGKATRQDLYSATHDARIKKGIHGANVAMVSFKFDDLRNLQRAYAENTERSAALTKAAPGESASPAMFHLPNGQTAGRLLTTAREQEEIRARIRSREMTKWYDESRAKHGVK